MNRRLGFSLLFAALSFLTACGGGGGTSTVQRPSTTVPLSITTTTLPGGVINAAYSATLTANGGSGTRAWSVSAGSLPPGLSLAGATGVISGTPTAAGAFTFTAAVHDSSGTATRQLSIAISSTARNETVATASRIGNGSFTATISPYVDPIGGPANPDTDYYSVSVAGGMLFSVSVTAANGALDPVIEIVNASGQRLTNCRNLGGDDGVTGTPDPTPNAFDDVCLNDDISLGFDTNSFLELQLPGTATQEVFIRVLDFRGDARPDMRYTIQITNAAP